MLPLSRPNPSQADGGYLGPDIHTFVSAVFSGAAGVFIATLDHDAGISTLLTVTPGQSVSVTGDPSFAPVPDGPVPEAPEYNMRDAPLWGTGSLALPHAVSWRHRLTAANTVHTGSPLARPA